VGCPLVLISVGGTYRYRSRILDWWKPVQAVGPEDEIERFANRALTHVVRTNKQGVTIEPKIGGFNAPEVFDFELDYFHAGFLDSAATSSMVPVVARGNPSHGSLGVPESLHDQTF
jgi:hypothetical protein